ncbi:MAG TPA: regulatory protein RecX [Phycisphaerales bacterium]|nr:regulatory protein RecX [Phycisphaerales bacterium]HMP36745.1 regulatory protein RecX [Phycisphaerales bacterium]
MTIEPAAPARSARRGARGSAAPAAASGSITAIEARPRDPAARVIHVGDAVVAELLASHAAELDLRVGRRWTPALARRVEAFATALAARRDAMAILGRSAMSSGRLRARLLRRGHPDEIAQGAISELVAHGWLNDAVYARTIAAEAIRRGSISRAALVARLRRREIDEELAERVASEAIRDAAGGAGGGETRGHELESCRRAAEKLVRRGASAAGDARHAARRVASALARRGFDPDIIAAVLRSSSDEP